MLWEELGNEAMLCYGSLIPRRSFLRTDRGNEPGDEASAMGGAWTRGYAILVEMGLTWGTTGREGSTPH